MSKTVKSRHPWFEHIHLEIDENNKRIWHRNNNIEDLNIREDIEMCFSLTGTDPEYLECQNISVHDFYESIYETKIPEKYQLYLKDYDTSNHGHSMEFISYEKIQARTYAKLFAQLGERKLYENLNQMYYEYPDCVYLNIKMIGNDLYFYYAR